MLQRISQEVNFNNVLLHLTFNRDVSSKIFFSDPVFTLGNTFKNAIVTKLI